MKIKFILKFVAVASFFLAIFFAPQASVFAETATTTDIAPVSIHLDIMTATSTLFSGEITVEACEHFASSTATVSGYCAVEQSGLPSEWSSYGSDKFLASIGGVANDFNNGQYWGWFANLEYGQTSLNQHVLSANESLLITIGRMPLKLIVSTTTPAVNGTTTASVLELGFDDSWNAVWLPSASSSINVSGSLYSADADGNYDIFASSSAPLEIFATKNGFIDSPSVIIFPVSINDAPTPTPEPTPESVGGGSVGGTSLSQCTFDVNKAITFLTDKQRTDGSFESSLHTDWAIIGLASVSGIRNRDGLISYLQNQSGSLSSITDYERRAMALMAMGINPYDGTSVNYIKKISDAFDGTQIGVPSLVNDDVFAIFLLIKSGYSVNDAIIQKTADFIISKQRSNGSWENSVDFTASAIQALTLIQSLGGVNDSIMNARSYLLSRQQDDGGFGSSFSTSWVLQAIASLGESDSGWTKNNKTPKNALCLLQQSDGGLESASTDINTRIWATAYAIPAVSGKTWPMILSSFARQISETSVPTPSPVNSSVVIATATPSPTVTPTPAPTPVSSYTPAISVEEGTPKSAERIQLTQVLPNDAEAATTSQRQENSFMLAAVAENKSKVPGQFMMILGTLIILGGATTFIIIKNK